MREEKRRARLGRRCAGEDGRQGYGVRVGTLMLCPGGLLRYRGCEQSGQR
jgi:hypothetical protein